MNLFNFLKKGASKEEMESRRVFIRNSLAASFGAAALLRADKLFAGKSKTGFIYAKENGEIINHYEPQGGSSPYVGETSCFAFNFAPSGWQTCNGALLPISEYDVLFALIGTTYGGDGVNSFGVPDLQGRGPIHMGQGPGLTSRTMGETSGAEIVTLISNHMPSHNHNLNVNSSIGNSKSPNGNYLAQNADAVSNYGTSTGATMNNLTIGATGGSQFHNNMAPYLALNFCISLFGVFPTQG